MTDVELAYIAGIVDGEGYIGIKRVTTLTGGRVNPTYLERLQIRMVDEGAIKFIAETLGGWYYPEKAHAVKGRPLFCFQASDKAAVAIIRQLLPYLRVKRAVAETVLCFSELRANPDKEAVAVTMNGRWGKPITVRRYRFSQAHIARCEELWSKCSNINHGIS